MSDLPDYQAGYAGITMAVDTKTLRAQAHQDRAHGKSPYTNKETPNFDLHSGEIAFMYCPRYGVRTRYEGSGAISNRVVTAITNLSSLPFDDMREGIGRVAEAYKLPPEIVNRSVLSCIQTAGITAQDYILHEEREDDGADIAMQVAGVVTMAAYQDMNIGDMVRAAIPPEALFTDCEEWGRGVDKTPAGKIKLIAQKVSEYDVCNFMQTFINHYMYNAGRDTLRIIRNERSYCVYTNMIEAMNQSMVTIGIMFTVALHEQGLISIPSPTAEMMTTGEGLNKGTVGIANDETGKQVYGERYEGNHGSAYYPRDWNFRNVASSPSVKTPTDLGVFLGITTGLLERPGSGIIRKDNDVVSHARRVMIDPAFKHQRTGIAKCVTRFLRMMSYTEGDVGGKQMQEEFGMEQYGPVSRRKHHARDIKSELEASTIKDSPAGKLLEEQHLAVPSWVIAITNAFSENMSLYMGRVVRNGKAGGVFSFFFRS